MNFTNIFWIFTYIIWLNCKTHSTMCHCIIWNHYHYRHSKSKLYLINKPPLWNEMFNSDKLFSTLRYTLSKIISPQLHSIRTLRTHSNYSKIKCSVPTDRSKFQNEARNGFILNSTVWNLEKAVVIRLCFILVFIFCFLRRKNWKTRMQEKLDLLLHWPEWLNQARKLLLHIMHTEN